MIEIKVNVTCVGSVIRQNDEELKRWILDIIQINDVCFFIDKRYFFKLDISKQCRLAF